MDPDAITTARSQLVAWGVLEPDAPRLTRRAQAAVARAAQTLREEEVKGTPRPGHPLLLTAQLALAELAPAATVTADHYRVLAAVELSSLPEGVRAMFSAP